MVVGDVLDVELEAVKAPVPLETKLSPTFEPVPAALSVGELPLAALVKDR